ncbi:MAG: hypothetical protein FJ027_03945 [Candidatus Rokubacteria bacterium]|nr:hypothetical protein [Candidatus Rokubacteria bacterium]
MKLALLEDRVERGTPLALGAADRVLYVVTGDVEIQDRDGARMLGENQAWHGAAAPVVHARSSATLWRWELRDGASPNDGGVVKLEREVDVARAGSLMRCDRVDFPPGGVAYTHTHQGPGIRVLLHGTFRVEVEGRSTAVAPGEAWFERGPDPVYAEAGPDAPAAFVRVMVLPAALLGKSSIRYVKAEDQDRPKSQRYSVFVDALLA